MFGHQHNGGGFKTGWDCCLDRGQVENVHRNLDQLRGTRAVIPLGPAAWEALILLSAASSSRECDVVCGELEFDGSSLIVKSYSIILYLFIDLCSCEDNVLRPEGLQT